MEISLEDDERTLTMVEDLCSEDVAGNASSLLPAPLADDRDAAAAPGHTSNKGVKVNKEKILTELEEAMTKLTVVHADLRECIAIQQKLRFLVSKDKLFELAGDNCKFTVDDHLCGGECISKLRKSELSFKLHVYVTITFQEMDII